MIVSLLDIHVFPPPPNAAEQDHEPLEILEAGTGHGSLTLHLSRAINAANSCPPPIPQTSQRQILASGSQGRTENDRDHEEKKSDAEDRGQQEWDSWRSQRRAVIHTVDVSPKYSGHAEKIVRGFRRGIYAGNIDFYVSSVEEWIKEQTSRRQTRSLMTRTVKPFLSHAILDMPSAHLRIPYVAPIIKNNGILAVFMPNVTQIGECVEIIRKQRLPFVLDKAVELGMGISSGRLWNINMVKKPTTATDIEEERETDSDESSENQPDEISSKSKKDTDGEMVMVCRPKVGGKIVGGGFVGIWRRTKD